MTIEHDSFPHPGIRDESFHVQDWEGVRLLASAVYRCNIQRKTVAAFVQVIRDGEGATCDLTIDECRRLAYILNHCANEREDAIEREYREANR